MGCHFGSFERTHIAEYRLGTAFILRHRVECLFVDIALHEVRVAILAFLRKLDGRKVEIDTLAADIDCLILINRDENAFASLGCDQLRTPELSTKSRLIVKEN